MTSSGDQLHHITLHYTRSFYGSQTTNDVANYRLLLE